MKIDLVSVVGRGYGEYWNCKKRYRVCKGGRASKKSKTTALNFIVRIMQYPNANLLVVRRVFRTIKDSCFSELKWAMNRLGVAKYWDVKESPLEMTYIPTGQKIFFRGLDDPIKITSITVEHGVLCWLWVEEAFELSSEDDFDMLDESIRGAMPEGLFKQVTITFNPWNERHWLKRRFFDSDCDDVLAMTTDYTCNEWLDKADLEFFERLKATNPKRYRVVGMGEWGITDGAVFDNYEITSFDIEEVCAKPNVQAAFGLDFGYVNDPSALFCGLVDKGAKVIYVFDEIYEYGLSNERLFEKIAGAGYCKEHITADAAEPKSIDRLRTLGLYHITPAKKGNDSVKSGIDFLSDFHIIIHPKCKNFINEISNYCWETDNNGKLSNNPRDCFNHLMDAMRYAMERFSVPCNFSF